MKAYLINLGDALSQLGNALFLAGEANHSISGDAYRYNRRRAMAVIDALFRPWEDDHCRRSYEHDVSRAGALMQEHSKRQKAREN